ncbi:hypothetical protein LINPERHAP1_LOCUS15599 [Linum perenne]
MISQGSTSASSSRW